MDECDCQKFLAGLLDFPIARLSIGRGGPHTRSAHATDHNKVGTRYWGWGGGGGCQGVWGGCMRECSYSVEVQGLSAEMRTRGLRDKFTVGRRDVYIISDN